MFYHHFNPSRRRSVLYTLLCAVLLVSIMPATSALSQSDALTTGAIPRGPSGLPLPRFVSLKSGRVNMRVGPGTQYAVEWLYMKPGLPLEIIQEYDNWRRVRDADGAEGWIFHSLLSGQRMGAIAPWLKDKDTTVPLLEKPQDGAVQSAQVEPGAIGEVVTCSGEWCRMKFSRPTGWIRQSSIWGVYPGEVVME